MFNQLVKAIALYGAEVWAPYLLKCARMPKLMESIYKFCCDKLNLTLFRHILVVHRKFQLSVIMDELGRYPLAIDIMYGGISSQTEII